MSKSNKVIANKVCQLYRDKNNKKELHKYVREFTENTLQSLIKDNIMTSIGCDLMDGLLLGLAESSEDLNKRFIVIDLVLIELRQAKIPETMINTMVPSIILEMPHLLSEHLIKLTENCIHSISNDSDIHTSWKDILPECLRLLSARSGVVTHRDTTSSPSEFVSRCLRSLFQSKWPLSIMTPLTVMFQDINLSKEEHLEAVNKLCFELDQLPSDSLPPLIHQLLRLCKSQNGPIVFFRLNDYFYARLYKENEFKDTMEQESESPIMDFDSIDVVNDDSVYKAEATCLYHACRGGSALKKLLVTLRGLVRRPSVLLSAPTLLQMLLSVEQQQEIYITIIRSYLQHNYMEEMRRKEFAWCKDTINPGINVKQLMTTLVENCAKYCPITGEGLLYLAMSLIGTGGLLPTTKSTEELGTFLLVKLIKKRPEAAQQALKLLRDKLKSDSTNIQNVAETLKALFVYMPFAMMEYTSILQGILEDCFELPEGRNWNDHCLVIEAFRSVIKLNSRIRDTLVMVCRKGLFSRDPGIGRIAVCGYLCLIKSLKNSSESFSQDNSNTFSILSQISQNYHSSQTGTSGRINNGTVCMEVITLLRRCFVHSKEVRDHLYLGLTHTLHGRPVLLDPIFNIIHKHLTSHYYVSDTEALPPLNLKKCLNIRDDSVTLQEPLGRLLFTIQNLLLCDPSGKDEPAGWSLGGSTEKFNGISGKLYVIMLSLSNRLGKCIPTHFNEDNGVSLSEIGLESKEKCLILQQALLCYEALMAFRINEWTPSKTDQPQKLLNLHKIYIQLFDFTKANLSKTKKDSGGKKGRKGKKTKDKDTSVGEDDDDKNKKGKKPMKLSDIAKNRNVGFKVLPTIWDLYTLSRSFDLLYENTVNWTTTDQLNQIRTKRELHRSVVKLGIGIITNLKSKRLTQQQRQEIYKCAKCLYVNCISKLNDFSSFDQETSLLIVECFHGLLQLIMNENLPDFLNNIGSMQENGEIGEKISTIAEVLGVQLELAITDAPLNEDPAAQKIVPALFNLISDLLRQLTPDIFICDKWTNWLQKLTSRSCDTSKTIGSSAISVMLTLVAKSADAWSICDVLVKKLTQVMGLNEDKENIDNESTTDITDFGTISLASSPNVFMALCNHLNTRFSVIETVIGRLRADHGFLQYRKPSQISTAQASLKNRERAVCSEMCRAATLVQQLAMILCPAGPCCFNIIRIVSRLHALLSTLTAHFTGRDARSIHSARFEKLVKISGKSMSRTIDSLILHVEGLREGTAPSGTKGQARIIKDTKFIPRLVYNCELFYKRIHQLYAKTKVHLVSHLSKGSARDFRIKASTVKEILKSHEVDNDVEDPDTSAMDVEDDAPMDVTPDQPEITEESKKNSGEDSDTEMDEE